MILNATPPGRATPAVFEVRARPSFLRTTPAKKTRTAARIWDAMTGMEISVLRGHENWVRSAAFSPDVGHIVTASDDRDARIWDATTGRR
jgi:WD40 repeat protein